MQLSHFCIVIQTVSALLSVCIPSLNILRHKDILTQNLTHSVCKLAQSSYTQEHPEIKFVFFQNQILSANLVPNQTFGDFIVWSVK